MPPESTPSTACDALLKQSPTKTQSSTVAVAALNGDDFASALERAIARSGKGAPKMIDAKAVELPEWVVQASWLMVPTHETR